MNLGDGPTAKMGEPDVPDDDALDPHLERIKNAVEESDEEVL